MSTAQEQAALSKKSQPALQKLSKAIDDAVLEMGPIQVVFYLELAKSTIIETTAVEAINKHGGST